METQTPRIVIKDTSLFGTWQWDCKYDNCPICRCGLTTNCIVCSSENNCNCNIVRGKCGHYFHYHCIIKWLNTRHVCPLCNSNWEFTTNDKK